MEVILKVCMVFGLTVLETKTEVACLHRKDTPTLEFSAQAAGQVYKQTNKFVHREGGYPRHTRHLCGYRQTSAASVGPIP